MRLVRRVVRRTRRLSGRRRRGYGGYRYKRVVTPLYLVWAGTSLSGGYVITSEAGAVTAPPAGWDIGGVSNPGTSGIVGLTTVYGDINNITGAGGLQYLDIPFSMNFTMGDVVRVQDFVDLYDSYKLGYIKLKFIPTWDSKEAQLPRLEYSLDRDDSALPNPGQWRERMNVKAAQLARPVTVGFKPTQLMPTLRSGAGSTYPTIVGAKWNNSAQIDIEHFGVKGFFRGMPQFPVGGSANNLAKIKIEATYYFRCRGVQ